ncbi:MAG TPA: ABC transporter ATP-binding protein [Acidimicrobiales bacterium]|nr:ABC transporter ATP-binding protein [Acidimicrobiales bacterium]
MPTPPEGAVRARHLWKSFKADPARPMLRDHVHSLGRALRGQRRRLRWVLKDVNLEVEPGSSLAVVGANGSGKSTLLKVMAKVTFPSAGYCEVGGRVGAMIEVRSGIHPDLSGRENVYFYGTVLGLSRRQVAARFDEIVDFAGLADAIDRPVKFYSTGMQMRLGFSIAAFMEPDVLLVDEVLAVGDASFQQKCLQRMNDVVAMGTTLVLVSHDLAAVEAMCERAVWLADARVAAEGPVRQVLSAYRSSVEQDAGLATRADGPVRVLKAAISGPGASQLRSGGPAEVRLVLQSDAGAGEARLHLGVSEGTAMPVFLVAHHGLFPEGELEMACRMEQLPLMAGRYYLWMAMQAPGGLTLAPWQPLTTFEVFGPSPRRPPNGVMVLAPIHVEAKWQLS